MFLRAPLLARECRIYIYNLALRLGLPVKGAELAEGIEIFPKHDELGLVLRDQYTVAFHRAR